jgi:hypothetical protein
MTETEPSLPDDQQPPDADTAPEPENDVVIDTPPVPETDGEAEPESGTEATDG